MGKLDGNKVYVWITMYK